MNLYEPWVVYTNIHAMMPYRGMKPRAAMMTEKQLTAAMNAMEYLAIIADRAAQPELGVTAATVWIILIAPGSMFGARKNEMLKLAALVKPSAADIGPLEYMFVSHDPFGSHLIKGLADIRKKHWVEHHTYDKFIVNIMLHEEVPRHEIARVAEMAEHYSNHGGGPENFPRITPTDPAAVWIGLRPGQVCKIYRISELSGIAIAYRYCA